MKSLKKICVPIKSEHKIQKQQLHLIHITQRLALVSTKQPETEKLPTHSLDRAVKLISQEHNKYYMIVNLTSHKVHEKRTINIMNYEWEDVVPCLEQIFIICDDIAQFFRGDDRRLTAVHCHQNKGRAGLIICCFLLYCKMFSDKDEAIFHYTKQSGHGIKQAAHIRYLEYFARILRGKRNLPRVLTLENVRLVGRINQNSVYIKVKNLTQNQPIIYSVPAKPIQKDGNVEILVPIREKRYLTGDIKIQIKTQDSEGARFIGTYYLNTGFIEPGREEILTDILRLSPFSQIKHSGVSPNVKIIFKFKQDCKCAYQSSMKQKCQNCKAIVRSEIEKWGKIDRCLAKRSVIPNADLHQFLDIPFKQAQERQKNIKYRKKSQNYIEQQTHKKHHHSKSKSKIQKS